MLKVTIEILPHGREEDRRTIGIINIGNDGTGTEEIGNYNFALSKPLPTDSKSLLWRKGRVEGFKRMSSLFNIYDLVYLVLRTAVGKRN